VNLLVDAVNRHPAIVVFVVLLALGLVAFAADVFVGFAEREPVTKVRR
jgi:predicted tellurium resistance membrane protein TerC